MGKFLAEPVTGRSVVGNNYAGDILRANFLAVRFLRAQCLAQGQVAHSRELFDDDKPPTFSAGQSIYGDDTIGNYQLYAGNGYWQFEDASISWSGGRADSIPMGVLRLTRWEGDEIVAAQTGDRQSAGQ